ncbi:MAG: alpha/beta hydrolase [Candidatus Competibacterales bacterium]|nr:alpha/beta hydrolase [Candidatus Competibacterales bacterium]
MQLRIDGHPVQVYTGTREPRPGRFTLLFVHGAGMDHSVWVLQSRYFAFHSDNVLAVDLPGHGGSGGAPLPRIEVLGDWLARVLDATGAGPAAVIGHSMGALAALELAARHPGRIAGLALLGVGYPMPVADALLAAARDDLPAAIGMIVRWGHGSRAQLGGNRVPGLWLTGMTERLLERSAPGVLHADLAACNDYAGGLESAARVRCPTLLISGQRDLMTPPRAARALGDAIASSRSVLVEDCGHMLMGESPDAVLDALIDWRRPLNGI